MSACRKRTSSRIGPFDQDTLKHTGEPSVELTARSKGTSTDKVRACASAATDAVERAHTEHGEAFKGVSRRWVEGQINVDAAAEKRAGIEEAVRVGSIRTEDGPNRSILHFWVKEYPEDDDG